MKYLDPLHFARAETAAPALARGLAVLVALGTQSLALEALAAKLKLPKASVFRLLGALQEIGLVRKTPEKCYEALCVLRLLADEQSLFRERVARKLPEVCRKAGATIEWYEPTAGGMRLVSQAHPDTEVRVQAQPGFVRKWGEEFDAVARLGYAFDPQAPALGQLYGYAGDGVQETIPGKKAQALLAEATREEVAADIHFNTNGVRRCAAAILEEGKFRGVLALAEAFHFSEATRQSRYMEILREALIEI